MLATSNLPIFPIQAGNCGRCGSARVTLVLMT